MTNPEPLLCFDKWEMKSAPIYSFPCRAGVDPQDPDVLRRLKGLIEKEYTWFTPPTADWLSFTVTVEQGKSKVHIYSFQLPGEKRQRRWCIDFHEQRAWNYGEGRYQMCCCPPQCGDCHWSETTSGSGLCSCEEERERRTQLARSQMSMEDLIVQCALSVLVSHRCIEQVDDVFAEMLNQLVRQHQWSREQVADVLKKHNLYEFVINRSCAPEYNEQW